MKDNKKEKYIIGSPSPVSLKGTKNIFDQTNNNCVCRIYNNQRGTGFFTKIPYKDKLLPVLITNNHIIDENDLKDNNIINLSINNNQEKRIIKIDEKRIRYTNQELDITIIEIREKEDKLNNKYIELDDNIINYFTTNIKEEPSYLNKIYSNESIYVINYPKDKDIVVSYGEPPKIDKSEIKHKCCTEDGSSGSPILLISNQKLIGIHYGCSENFQFNKGTLIIYSIIELEKRNSNLKEEINKENENYILAEFEVEEDNEKVRIINSYEQYCEGRLGLENDKEYENEKEIKENCTIRINNKIIPFSYFYKFHKRGKYNIKYTYKRNLIKLDYMFDGCSSLTNLDLSNFNTNNVRNISFMFYGCSSLTNLDLSNFTTNKVSSMEGMFQGCSSLTNLNLSNFNTNNVRNMSYMFSGCKNLSNYKIIVNDKNILNKLNKL